MSAKTNQRAVRVQRSNYPLDLGPSTLNRRTKWERASRREGFASLAAWVRFHCDRQSKTNDLTLSLTGEEHSVLLEALEFLNSEECIALRDARVLWNGGILRYIHKRLRDLTTKKEKP